MPSFDCTHILYIASLNGLYLLWSHMNQKPLKGYVDCSKSDNGMREFQAQMFRRAAFFGKQQYLCCFVLFLGFLTQHLDMVQGVRYLAMV